MEAGRVVNAQEIVSAIFRSHEDAADPLPRSHAGASVAGHPCDRYQWLQFRWAEAPGWSGRMLRMFGTGHREEARLIEELQRIGITVSTGPEPGKQWNFAFADGHGGGSLDGMVCVDGEWMVLECKTANARSSADLQKKGVMLSKPQHYTQMQIYMRLAEVGRALYLSVNKDTDDIYSEIVGLDAAHADAALERVQRIVSAAEPPDRVSANPADFSCKFCPLHGQCHGTTAPLANCRTCAFSTPVEGGRWVCEKRGIDLPRDLQVIGCDQHRLIPRMLDAWADMVAVDGDHITYRMADGGTFINGEISSVEIRAAQDKAALGDKNVRTLRLQFGGRIVA